MEAIAIVTVLSLVHFVWFSIRSLGFSTGFIATAVLLVWSLVAAVLNLL